jgi:signal transduction histidine kinase
MIPIASEAPQCAAAKNKSNTTRRSPMAQLLHALNQPLTGLQCSMEVALACPRTREQYVRGLHDGLKLTERMRALVAAIREVADTEEEQTEEAQRTEPGTTDLRILLREAVEDLRPVGEAKNISIAMDLSSAAAVIKARRSDLSGAMFRLLDATLALANSGTALRIESGSGSSEGWFRIQWQTPREEEPPVLSQPELGLLIAQAQLERSGAEWLREATEDGERLTVRIPRILSAGGSF